MSSVHLQRKLSVSTKKLNVSGSDSGGTLEVRSKCEKVQRLQRLMLSRSCVSEHSTRPGIFGSPGKQKHFLFIELETPMALASGSCHACL